MKRNALLLVFAAGNAVWCVALLVAPLSLPAGTVVGLDGRANVVDHPDQWRTLPWFPRLVYTAGDLNCHQIASRSWTLAGNQLPVDVRMLAGFLLGNLGFALALRGTASWRYRDAAAQFWPPRLRARLDSPQRRLGALTLLWVLAAAPATLDVFVQMLTPYESTNLNRFWTGALLGVLGAYLIGTLLRTLLESKVLLAPTQQHA